MLGALRQVWAPEAFVVSFKLETNDKILIHKVLPPPWSLCESLAELAEAQIAWKTADALYLSLERLEKNTFKLPPKERYMIKATCCRHVPQLIIMGCTLW